MTGSEATVLVVDDDATLIELYSVWLDDYAVITAAGGTEALDLADEDVDTVLLDRQMPDLSGDETLRRLRERGLDCPVAMVTGVEPATDVIDLGFDDYVCKPVRGREVRRVVADLLRRATYDAEVREYFALASKRAALRATLDEGELDESAAFRRLSSEFDRAADRARESRDELLGAEGFAETLRRTVGRPDDG